MAEISEAIAMIKKAESDAEQLILDSESKSVDMINESKINAENIINEAKKAAEEEAKNTVFDEEKAMANVDDAASIIVKNVL